MYVEERFVTAEWMGSLRSGFISENCHLLSQSQTRHARLNKGSKRLSCLLIFKGVLSGEGCDVLSHSCSEILPWSHTSPGFQKSSSFEYAPPTACLVTKFSVWKHECTVAWGIYLGFLFSSLQCQFWTRVDLHINGVHLHSIFVATFFL